MACTFLVERIRKGVADCSTQLEPMKEDTPYLNTSKSTLNDELQSGELVSLLKV